MYSIQALMLSWSHVMTEPYSWRSILQHATKRPSMFIGSQSSGHLGRSIRDVLRLTFEKEGFLDVKGATVVVSPHASHTRVSSGPVDPRIERLIDWGTCDILLQGLSQAATRISECEERWAANLYESTFGLISCACALYLADRGALGWRTSMGLWVQSYEHGWPVTPPFLVEDAGESVGLMVAATLSPRWFQGLPFTAEDVQQAIPEVARPYVTVEWHPQDDVVPECQLDPACILRRENVHRWL